MLLWKANVNNNNNIFSTEMFIRSNNILQQLISLAFIRTTDSTELVTIAWLKWLVW